MLALFTIALIVSSWRCLPETLPARSRQPMKLRPVVRNYLKVLSNVRFVFAIAAVALAFSGFSLYIASAPRFILDILNLPETAFGWLFVPFIGGMVLGSMLSSRLAGKVGPETLIITGQIIMGLGAVYNVVYNLLFEPAVPWAVIPIAIYGFGMSTALPGMTVVTLSIFPSMRGMASSIQGTMQMLVFAFVAGFVAPLLYGSALHLAIGTVVGAALCAITWQISKKLDVPGGVPAE